MEHGYRIPFREGVVPGPYREANNRSALDNMPYLQEHVETLLLDTTVDEVFSQPLCCSPLTVASRYVDDRKYLGFSIPDKSGRDHYFVFRVLPFGLATAVQLLARMTKPICIFLAGEGIRLFIYIDDGWILAYLRELAALHLQRTFDVLAQAGFIISASKADTAEDISQCKKHLEFLVDSVHMIVSAPAQKLEDVQMLIRQTLVCPSYSPRQLAKVTGKVVSLLPAFGPILMVLSRLAQSELAAFTEKNSWSALMCLSLEAKDALLLLADSLPALNGYPVRNEATSILLSTFLGHPDDRVIHGVLNPHAIIASDASDRAVCAYEVQGAGGLFHQELFTASESELSSGHRELLAVKFALQALPPSDRSTALSVFWLTDSQNLVAFLSKGTLKREIQLTVLDIYRLARTHLLDMIPIYLQRSDFRIQVSDYGSRFFDADDWACDVQSFESLTRFWPASIDLFAHFSNAQVPKFYSYGNSPHTAGIDAFTHDWSGEIAWCCPPVNLVIPAVRKIAASVMQAILIIPLSLIHI